jgi:hypothetical protein|tara:strand:+ start:203 stop:751 length:549 start_codon:yes stop_codon:yes gene_type:complete
MTWIEGDVDLHTLISQRMARLSPAEKELSACVMDRTNQVIEQTISATTQQNDVKRLILTMQDEPDALCTALVALRPRLPDNLLGTLFRSFCPADPVRAKANGLLFYVSLKDTEMVSAMLAAGVSPDAVEDSSQPSGIEGMPHGYSVLYVSMARKHLGIARMLVEAGANLDMTMGPEEVSGDF